MKTKVFPSQSSSLPPFFRPAKESSFFLFSAETAARRSLRRRRNGDSELAKSIVSPLMQSDEAQALIEKINERA